MKIAVLSYSTQNLGDDLQSLALERLLPRVDLRIDRDDVSAARDWGSDVRWIINGWHASGIHKVWPPQTGAKCLFVGFHAAEAAVLPPRPELPLGCRDPWTLGLCAQRGIEGWISWCATLTLGPSSEPREGDVLLVDVPESIRAELPPEIASGARRTHLLKPGSDRLMEARGRLAEYARARWVVTTRLHALLPCAALGTPIVYIEPPNAASKAAGYKHLGWRIKSAPWDRPRPRVEPEVVASLTAPLQDAVRRFLES